jgi:hypothetical protein
MSEDIIFINQGSVLSFDGIPQNYQMWWTKFRAFGTLSRFAEAIKEDPDPMLPTSLTTAVEDTEDAANMKIAIRKNDLAMSSFTIVFTKEGIMRLVS